MSEVAEIIRTVGFPIACCIYLGYFIKSLTDQYRDDVKQITQKYDLALKEITEKYERAIDKFSKSIDKNTQVLTSLDNRLGIEGSGVNEGQL